MRAGGAEFSGMMARNFLVMGVGLDAGSWKAARLGKEEGVDPGTKSRDDGGVMRSCNGSVPELIQPSPFIDFGGLFQEGGNALGLVDCAESVRRIQQLALGLGPAGA